MRHTADVTGSKPIAILLQSISGVSTINPLVAFYDIHGGKREVLFFYANILLYLPISYFLSLFTVVVMRYLCTDCARKRLHESLDFRSSFKHNKTAFALPLLSLNDLL
jgi:hypothetical protein